jgi:hypothetical protein
VAFPTAHRQSIVERVGVCLDVLEGRSKRMLPRHALCWLAHLVGDNRDLARHQLASAAFRLAEMLNGLRWK